MSRGPTTRKGMTLVELLVILFVVFIVFSLALPSVLAAREAARRSTCKSNLKSISVALHNYHDTHRFFPPGWIPEEPALTSTAPSRWSWSVFILPFADQAYLYNQLNVAVGTASVPPAGDLRDKRLPVYICPNDFR